MKIKLSEIYAANSAFIKITNQDLPIRLAFRLGQDVRIISEIFRDVEAQRLKLVNKLGAPNADGQTQVTQENMKTFTDEFSTLLEEEVDLPIQPINLDELGAVTLTPKEVLTLEPFMIKVKKET